MEARELLRRTREARGITQEQLAHLAGLTRNALSDYERGQYNPRRQVAQTLDDLLEAGGELVLAYYPGTTELELLRADHEVLVERVAQLSEQMTRVLRLLAD